MQETVESQSLQRRAWRRLVYAALIATTLIAVATQIDIPILTDVIKPTRFKPCPDDPECREFVRMEIQDALERARRERFFDSIRSVEGGDAAGQPPPGGGGGGQPGGQAPPAEQGVLDPIIDPVAPGADCDVTIEDVILCTEPD